jgi:hypothetical protein
LGSNVYAAGLIVGMPDGSWTRDIGRWNGSNWLALGLRVTGLSSFSTVSQFAASGSSFYVGGSFTNVNGVAANNIAKWDGTNWSALGSGVAGNSGSPVYVAPLALSGSDLYVAGSFTTAGGRPANNIARWDGSNWSALGLGIGGSNIYLYALAVSASNVYVGGQFSTAGGIPANNIAKWNGSTWSALGSGVTGGGDYDPFVSALTVSGSGLYVGGNFTSAGGTVANHIAKWDGSTWSALGSGLGNVLYPEGVSALAVSGSDLYVGGYFRDAGGNAATGLAKWDATNWWALGSGVDGFVDDLAVAGNILYVRGQFGTAGGKVSPYIARAYLELPTLSYQRTGGSMTLFWPTFGQIPLGEFALQQNPNTANANEWSYSNYQLSTNEAIKSVTVPITSGNQFFRLIGN